MARISSMPVVLVLSAFLLGALAVSSRAVEIADLPSANGGEASGGPCDPTAPHSLVGLDAEFVDRVAAWMRGCF